MPVFPHLAAHHHSALSFLIPIFQLFSFLFPFFTFAKGYLVSACVVLYMVFMHIAFKTLCFILLKKTPTARAGVSWRKPTGEKASL
jgi:hypothetical protein